MAPIIWGEAPAWCGAAPACGGRLVGLGLEGGRRGRKRGFRPVIVVLFRGLS